MVSLPKHLKSAPIGRQQLPREVVAEHQRERVAAAAAEVFAKRGYQGTTVDNIVSAAKIGVGSFYSLFDGKEDCFLAVYEQIVEEGRERIWASLPTGESWPQRLAAGLRAVLELIEAEPLSARVALIEVQTAGDAALAHHERHLEEIAALLSGARQFSPAPDELPSTLEFATVAGLTWFLQQRVVLGGAGSAAGLLPDVLEIVAGPYLGERATAELIASTRND